MLWTDVDGWLVGIVPSYPWITDRNIADWANDFAASGNLINARAEDLAGKRTSAEAVQRRRCLVPATSWFEWQTNPSNPEAKKTKHRLMPVINSPWALAAALTKWKTPMITSRNCVRIRNEATAGVRGYADMCLGYKNSGKARPHWRAGEDCAGSAALRGSIQGQSPCLLTKSVPTKSQNSLAVIKTAVEKERA